MCTLAYLPARNSVVKYRRFVTNRTVFRLIVKMARTIVPMARFLFGPARKSSQSKIHAFTRYATADEKYLKRAIPFRLRFNRWQFSK